MRLNYVEIVDYYKNILYVGLLIFKRILLLFLLQTMDICITLLTYEEFYISSYDNIIILIKT